MEKYPKFDLLSFFTRQLLPIHLTLILISKMIDSFEEIFLLNHCQSIQALYKLMKNIIESVLVKHLGKYIDGLKNSLDIGLLDGQVTIQNVSLRPSFVNELGLPFTLKFSHIERIHIDIPWTSLKDKNTIVTVKGIYALLNINYEEIEEDINPTQILKSMVERIKLQIKKKWTDVGVKDQTFAQKNLIRIVDNAVVNINNIHVRIQSFKRNWDYSLGIVIDNINSFTVDEYEQRAFYHRSFSKKETNKPLRKTLGIPSFKIYFNDEEKIFICNYLEHSHLFLLKMMAYPFAEKQRVSASPKKKKDQQDIKEVPHYELKTLGSISLTALGTQTLAEDLRYNINLNVHVTRIDFNISDRQLSQIMHLVQHFYQFGLNLDKNGRKAYKFQEDMQKVFKAMIAKICRQQKLIASEQQQLLFLIRQVPISILQGITDEVINQVRVDNQVKKIAKVTNVQKSKKMMEELLIKKEQLDAMQGFNIFKQVSIQTQIDSITLSFLNHNVSFASFGILGTSIDCIMNLNGLIRIGCKFVSSIIRFRDKQITQDLYDLSLPWLHIYFQINKNNIKKMHMALQKKEIAFNQEILCDFIDWLSLIRIRPTLFSYIEEQLNYSIDITKIMMKFMFEKGREIHWSLALPIVTLQVDTNTNLTFNLGHFFGQNSQTNDKFYIQFMEGLKISSNHKTLFQIDQGITITFADIDSNTSYQQVFFNIPRLSIQNIEQIIPLIYAVRKSNTFSIFVKYNAIELFDQTVDQELEGEFYLNKIKNKLTMKLSKTKLVFTPVDQSLVFPEQSISLTRTKIYKLVSQGRYFIVFKEEVDRLVNIVEASSQKTMETIYIKLRDYIHQICTSFQWHKYYSKPYPSSIESLQQIQDVHLNNDTLMALKITLGHMQFQFSPQSHLTLQKTSSNIFYNQFNTEAAVQLKKVDLTVDKEKIIYDASFKGSYQYLQSMLINLEVLHLGYEITLHKTFSTIINIASQYSILIFSLRAKNPKKYIEIQQDQNRLIGIKSQNSRTDNLNKFLLQRKFTIETTNIQGQILGYTNKLSYIKFQIQKYRNESQPHMRAQTKGIVLLSMIELPLISFKLTPAEFEIIVDSINAEIDLSVLIYEVIKGEGSLILRQIVRAYKNKEIAVNQTKKQQDRMAQKIRLRNQLIRKGSILKIDFIRIQVSITSSLCIGMLAKDVQLQVRRLSWTGLIFQLNKQCISTAYNNTIIKWSPTTVDAFMTYLKLKLNSKEVIFLFNQIYKIYHYLKSKHFDFIKFVEEEISKPDEQGRHLEQPSRLYTLRVEELQLVYECADRNPLISLRLKPIFLTTEGQVNSLTLSVWHLNRKLKLYEPVIEPFDLKIIQKTDSSQYQFLLDHLFLVVTQQLVIDVIQEIKLLKQIKKQMEKDQSNELQQFSREDVDLIKKGLFSEHFREYVGIDLEEAVQYSIALKITSYLSCKAMVEMRCGNLQKKQLLFEQDYISKGQGKLVNIAQKTSYSFSYELIQRYQKIHLKICLINQFYAIKSVQLSFLLYDKDNYYIQPITIVDANGAEKGANLAVKVQFCEGVYLIDIFGMYSIKNQTSLPLYFRYSDHFSINKFVLNQQEQIRLPLWIIDSINFGIEPNDYPHLLRLRPHDQVQGPGFYALDIKRDETYKAMILIHKQLIVHEKQQTPELKLSVGEEKMKQEQQQKKKNKQKKVNDHIKSDQDPHIFIYRMIPALLVRNHLQFPITINQSIFQYDQETQLLFMHEVKGREYIRLSLGDASIHQIYLEAVDEVTTLNLKIAEQNYVTLSLQLRKNKLSQRILHVYCEVHLIMNLHNMFTPTLKTNIYGHRFVLKKEVKNNYTDKIHPSPVLKDKFVFNTIHYLLNLQEKYITVEMNECKSNEIILYHSDFDKDLCFLNKQGKKQYIFAVNYLNKVVELQSQVQGRKLQLLECNYIYLMPKYYLINKADEILVIEGSIMIRSGQKIALDHIKGLDINIRDQLEFIYIENDFEQSSYLMFIRANEQSAEDRKQEMNSILAELDRRQRAESHANSHMQGERLEEISEASQHTSRREQIEEELNLPKSQYTIRKGTLSEDLQRNQPASKSISSEENNFTEEKYIDKVIEKQNQQGQKSAQVQNESEGEQLQDPFADLKHKVKMDDIMIFALSKRVCDYNTISYEVHEWNQWLTVKNQLQCPIILRTKLREGVLGQQIINVQQTGKILSGLSDLLQISVLYNKEELLLGHYDLGQRLNHNIFLNDYESREIILKEYKVKVGRYIVIESTQASKDKNIYKVVRSLNFTASRINLSLILHEERVRREMVRLTINHPRVMFLYYKNGLYMLHVQLEHIHGIFKRMTFLAIKDCQVFLEGLKGQFIERLSLSFGDTLKIVLTDDMIGSIMGQIEVFEKYLPKSQLLEQEQIILQQEQTYHINSLGIKGIQIKLCLRKIISEMNDHKRKIIEKLSLSMIEVQDATINLSPVQINVPLKQKHINGISQMYMMESFVGIASGLNILGNPSQFMDEFQAGRNRGGVLPFCRSFVAGVSNSLSKIIGTIGSGFSELTFDKEFMRNRIKDRNTKAESFGMGLKIGLKEFGYSLKSGITGLVQQPIQGHHEEGGVGILKGAFFGLTGLVTKPVTGLILAVSKTIQGINASISYLDYQNMLAQDLIVRPLYHKFKMVRPYKSEDQLAYNILVNWYDYNEVELVGSYLLTNQDEDAVAELLILTCSQLILIDLHEKQIVIKLRMDRLIATGKFLQGVVLYYRDEQEQDEQQQMVFRVQDNETKQNLYWTLKSFIYLYSLS